MPAAQHHQVQWQHFYIAQWRPLGNGLILVRQQANVKPEQPASQQSFQPSIAQLHIGIRRGGHTLVDALQCLVQFAEQGGDVRRELVMLNGLGCAEKQSGENDGLHGQRDLR